MKAYKLTHTGIDLSEGSQQEMYVFEKETASRVIGFFKSIITKDCPLDFKIEEIEIQTDKTAKEQILRLVEVLHDLH